MFSPRAMQEARLAASLKVEKVALAVDRSSFTIRDYESGRITPPTALIGPLADVLGVSIGDLFAEGSDENAAA